MIRIAQQALRGFFMGAADVVPGVSGGTVALLFGIYDRLVANIHTGASALGRLVKGDISGALARLRSVEWDFLVPLLVGILVALGALASVIDRLLADYPEEMAGLFFGLVVASIVVARAEITIWDGPRIIIASVSAVLTFVLLGFQSGSTVNPSLAALFGAGAIAICAMILPGVSGSFLLLMMGMYGAVLNSVTDRAIVDLLVFAAGATVGLAVFSTLLNWMLEHHRSTVVAALIGLMAGSLRVLWPWPNGVGAISEEQDEVISGTGIEWPDADNALLPVLLAVAAFGLVYGLSRLAEHRSQ